MAHTERLSIIRRIQKERKSKLLCYLTSDRPNAAAQVQKDAIPIFYEHLNQIGKTDRVDVFIVTLGGDTLAAFGLGRLVREFVPWVGALIPEKCHSAGTLFALAANEIVMTKVATLTPIDPSLVRPLNPAVELGPGQRQLVPVSVESVAGFKDLVSREWGIKQEEALAGIFKVLADRVHPITLGDVTRARDQIERLARKLLELHRKPDKTIDKVIATLTKELGSHDYLIGRTEARELLGKQVAAEDATVEQLLWELYRDFAAEMELGREYDAGMEIHAAKAAGATQPVKITQRIAVVESAPLTHVCEKEMLLNEISFQPPIPGVPPQRAVQQEVVRAGWRSYT
jgi:ClpP class serine protease